MKPPRMPLRNDRHTVTLVRPNGSPRPVLGTQSPQEDNRRAMIAMPVDLETHSGRPPVDKPATIDEPLPVRSQTILSYRLPRDVREIVNGGVTDAVSASRKTQDTIGVRIELKLD
jgi:hypothetical protein